MDEKEKALKKKNKILAEKKELWLDQRYKIWKKMFNTINEKLFKQLQNDNVDYVLFDSFDHFQVNYAEKTIKQLEESFLFKKGSLLLDNYNFHQSCNTEELKSFSCFLKDISKYIKDEKLTIVVFNSKAPVMEVNSIILKKFSSFRQLLEMGTGSKIYITNQKFDWIIEYTNFTKNIFFVKID